MNYCALQIPSLPAALRTVSDDPHLPGQAIIKCAVSGGFNSTANLPYEVSQQLLSIACWAAPTTTLERSTGARPCHLVRIVVYFLYNLSGAVTTSSK